MKIFSKPLLIILGIFLTWRAFLILAAILAVLFLPLGSRDRFLGGGPILYSLSPYFFSWANFDGEHYLSISIIGYRGLEQAFFPLYPILISLFAKPFSYDLISSLVNSIFAGLLISNTSLVFALIFLRKLIAYDYRNNIPYLTLIILLVFPTSFYFGAVYNESLYLLLSVLTFYLARKEKWAMASISGFLAATTRIFGILLFPALLIEAYQQKTKIKKAIWLLLIPCGLLIYMYYQYLSVGDPLAFYHLQKIVGEQHQSGFTLLPQVYYRYFKMLATVDTANPIYQTVVLELIVGLLFFILPIYGYFKKVRISYLFYSMVGFLLPTIQGSFSSVPRYVIVLFPAFLILAIWLNKMPLALKILLISLSALLCFIEAGLFLRGYWIA